MSAVTIESFKQHKRSIVDRYARPDNIRGLFQVLTTVLPIALLWYVATLGHEVGYGLSALATVAMSFFLVRVFVLMHECGHGSLFRSPALNRAFGFGFGVLSSMPQYVWSQHHNHHHATNGNWQQYRGPLSILSVDEYEALSPSRQRAYQRARDIRMAPLGGFVYLILNPRLTWLKGSASLLRHLVREKIRQPRRPLAAITASFRTRYWKTAGEYRHMSLNNLVLIASWVAMSWWMGPVMFFSIYIVSTSIAGAAGIVLFTVQHNFEHSYASADEDWDYDTAALDGTSFLTLPPWLNWFTANIGYHHIHHLSARIPNYRLAACHAEHAHLFSAVRRLTLRDVLPSLKFVLWDERLRRIVSVKEHEAATLARMAAVPA